MMAVFGFHRIESATGFEITRIAPPRFRRILGMIEESRRRIIANPLAGSLETGVLLTFDDGMACLCEHALPELRSRDWPGIVFLIPGAMGGRNDWDIRILGRSRPMMKWEEARLWADHGIEFGSHSMSHPDLTLLSPRALKSEMESSKAEIEDRLGRPVRFLSYPYGRHNDRVRAAAQNAGYQAAFGIVPKTGLENDRFAIPRLFVGALTTLHEVRSALSDDAGQRAWEGPSAWKRRFLHSLNAGSATVSGWRRCRSGNALSELDGTTPRVHHVKTTSTEKLHA